MSFFSRFQGSPAPFRLSLGRVVAVVLILVCAALLFVKGRSSESDQGDEALSETPVPGGTVVFALDEEPASLNLYSSAGQSSATSLLLAPVLSPLTRSRPDGDPEAVLLERLPEIVSSLPLAVRYTLRPDAVWDNGTAITATDVQYTLDQILAPGNEAIAKEGYDKIRDGLLRDVSEDARSFTLEFTETHTAWNELFALPTRPVLQRAALESVEFSVALLATVPFSSGPFRVEKWERGTRLTLVPNQNYWGDLPYLERVEFVFVESPALQAQALRSGEVQVVYQTQNARIAPAFAAVAGVDLLLAPSSSADELVFNTTRPFLDLLDVRQAIGYLLDRAELAEVVFGRAGVSGGDTAWRTFPALVHNVFYGSHNSEYLPNWQLYEHDVERAERLLGEAGFSLDAEGVWSKDQQQLAFALLVAQGNPLQEAAAEFIATKFGESGILLEVEWVSARDLSDRVRKCQYDIALVPSARDALSAQDGLRFLDDQSPCSGPDQRAAGPNISGFRDVEMSALLKDAARQRDAKDRATAYNAADGRLARNIPLLPLYQLPIVLAHYTALRGVTLYSEFPTWNLQEWWLDRPQPTRAQSARPQEPQEFQEGDPGTAGSAKPAGRRPSTRALGSRLASPLYEPGQPRSAQLRTAQQGQNR